MNLDYSKNSMEEVPFGQYLEQFQAMDPKAASVRTGIPYDTERQCFTMRMLQRTYEISWPECNVTCLDKAEGVFAIMEAAVDAKIFAIRYLLNGVKSESTGKFLTYRELPSGDLSVLNWTLFQTLWSVSAQRSLLLEMCLMKLSLLTAIL